MKLSNCLLSPLISGALSSAALPCLLIFTRTADLWTDGNIHLLFEPTVFIQLLLIRNEGFCFVIAALWIVERRRYCNDNLIEIKTRYFSLAGNSSISTRISIQKNPISIKIKSPVSADHNLGKYRSKSWQHRCDQHSSASSSASTGPTLGISESGKIKITMQTNNTWIESVPEQRIQPGQSKDFYFAFTKENYAMLADNRNVHMHAACTYCTWYDTKY